MTQYTTQHIKNLTFKENKTRIDATKLKPLLRPAHRVIANSNNYSTHTPVKVDQHTPLQQLIQPEIETPLFPKPARNLEIKIRESDPYQIRVG